MDAVEVVAVVGSCVPERMQHATRFAAMTNRGLVPAARLAGPGDPIAEAIRLAPWAGLATGAVVELPTETDVVELIGAMADERDSVLLTGVICVVDAGHLLDDLDQDDYLAVRTAHGEEQVARAMLAVRQIEYASTIVLANWTRLPTAELSLAMALLSHLNPAARLRLQREVLRPGPAAPAYGAAQDGAGWVRLLNGEFDPHMIDPRVGGFRYEHLRALHPGRLQRLLDDRIERGDFGTVVRSAGFCRLATRSRTVARWEHVGHMISLQPAALDDELRADDEVLSVGQELAFIGIDLDVGGLRRALDEVALTDAEFTAGPEAWARFPDPFPVWRTAPDRAE